MRKRKLSGQRRAHCPRDRRRPSAFDGGEFVECEASALPFRAESFFAVIANHSLEHFDDLTGTIVEIARGAAPRRLSLHRRSRRVDPYGSPVPLAVSRRRTRERISLRSRTGAHHQCSHWFPSSRDVGTPQLVTLSAGEAISSAPAAPNVADRKWKSRCIAILTYALRRIDKIFGTRLSVYGWALYFGNVPAPVKPREWTNVCVDCGVGSPATYYADCRFAGSYRCEQCGAWNFNHEGLTLFHWLVAKIFRAILEPRVLTQESQRHIPDGAVSLLGDDQIRLSLMSSRSRL